MDEQVTIIIEDLIPPANIATIDKDQLIGNAVSKEQYEKGKEEQDKKLAEIKEQVESDFKGVISPTDPTPTEDGSYKPSISSADPGTNYPNAGNLKAIKGFSTMFYKKGTVWTKSEEEMAKAAQNLTAFEALQFPVTAGTQSVYQETIWQVKVGKTATATDIPSYTSDIWVKVDKADGILSKVSENSVGNKTISTVADKIIRNNTFDQTFEIPPRVDGILKSGQYIKPNGTITTSTGTRQTIEIQLTAGVTAYYKGYNVGASGTVPNVVFVNASSVATVVSAGAASTSVAEPYDGNYTPTVNGTLYINTDTRPAYADKYLFYNDSSAILTLSYRQKMLSANRLDLEVTSIAYCGDSITRYGLDQTYGKGFQLVIQESAKFKTSTTYATGGFTLANLNASSTNWVSHDIFSLLIGINDHRLATPLGVLADFDNDTNNGTFYAELRKYVNKVYSLNNKAVIIMCTPTQVNTFPFTTTNPRNSFTKNAVNCDLNDYAEAIRTVSRKYSFPLADLFNECNQNILNIQQLTYEGVHQFSEGYRRIANIVMNAINKVI
ncbi:SGNH/GDSL hydrolase family protein [Chryseobacterium sp. HR92]|uniref:SGNH/GDSL hydrolase family protein n=1 Tax=Chryseobacterium sp. HR92 TaxID=3094839 RepID=UPI00388CF130|nr:GDSL-type esterase/lipase family protein [Chryseobacterium sp. HR92]